MTETAAPSGPKQRNGFLAFLARVPFTASVVVITLVLGIAFGTLWSAAQGKSWYHDVAYGLPAFQDGKFQTLLFGAFFAVKPLYYIWTIGFFAVLVGFSEWQLGTRRAIAITIGYQLLGVLAAAGFLLIFSATSWPWAQQVATVVDVNFMTGAVAAISVTSATLLPPWRLRLRLGIWTFVLFTLLFVGRLSSLQHFFAIVCSLPFSTRLAGPRGLRARALPTRNEIRLLATVGVLVVAGTQLLAYFLPDRLTPFGPSDDSDDTWSFLVVALLVSLLIANGLRKGYRWAWWWAVILSAIPLLLSGLVVVLAVVLLFVPDSDAVLDGIPQFAATAIMYLAFLIVLIAGRSAFRVPRRGRRKLATSSSQPEVAKDPAATVGRQHDLLDDHLAGEPAHDHR